MKEFYAKFYQPDNCVLIVAGQLEPEKTLGLIVKYFGALKRPDRKLSEPYTEEPPQKGERGVVLRRVGKIGAVGVSYHIPDGASEDFAAVEVLAEVLASQPSGRLYKELVETKKATSVAADAGAHHDPGLLDLTLQVEKGSSVEKAKEDLLAALDKAAEAKFTAEEVERAKKSLKSEFERAMTDSKTICFGLSEWISIGDWRLMFLHRDRTEKVTPDDVARVAKKYLKATNRTVGMFIPAETTDLATIEKTVDVVKLVESYKGRAAVAAGEAFDSSPAGIEKALKRVDLPFGTKLLLLPKKTRGESVVAQASILFGNLESLKGKAKAVEFMVTMLAKGTKKHTRQQLQDEFDKLGAIVQVFPSPAKSGEMSVAVQAKRSTLPAALALVEEMLKEPTFPEKEFEKLQREEVGQLEKALLEPTTLAQLELRRGLFKEYPKDDPRHVYKTPQEFLDATKGVTLDDLRKTHELLGAANITWSVVGDFDADAVAKQLEHGYKDWTSKSAYERIDRELSDKTLEKQVIQTPDKENAFLMTALPLSMNDADPDAPALTIANFVLGGGTLSNRLAVRVRQKDGLSYAVASIFQNEYDVKISVILAYAMCKPTNMAKVNAAIFEEVERFVKDGVKEEEFKEAVKGWSELRKQTFLTDQGICGTLIKNQQNGGRTLKHEIELQKKISELKLEDVNAAIKKRFDTKKFITVEAGDFEKKK